MSNANSRRSREELQGDPLDRLVYEALRAEGEVFPHTDREVENALARPTVEPLSREVLERAILIARFQRCQGSGRSSPLDSSLCAAAVMARRQMPSGRSPGSSD